MNVNVDSDVDVDVKIHDSRRACISLLESLADPIEAWVTEAQNKVQEALAKARRSGATLASKLRAVGEKRRSQKASEIQGVKNDQFRKLSETSNACFRWKHGSDRLETLPKRISDDPRQFNFRRTIFFVRQMFLVSIHLFPLFGPVLEAGQTNGPQNRIPRNISL